MAVTTTPRVISRVRDILGLRGSPIAHAQNSIFAVVVANPENEPVTIGFNRPTNQQKVQTFGNGTAGTAITAGTPITLYTVTTGKKLYLTSLLVGQNLAGQGPSILLKDGTTDMGAFFAGDRASAQLITGPTPVEISTSVRLDASGNTTVVYFGVGYEEDA